VGLKIGQSVFQFSALDRRKSENFSVSSSSSYGNAQHLGLVSSRKL